MEVGDRGHADPAQVAVDVAHQAVDLVAQDAVLLDALARGCRDLDEDRVRGVEPALLDELAVGPQACVDALGVVEAVDAEEDLPRAADGLTDLLGALLDRLRAGELLEAGGVDGDRERRGADLAPVGEVDGVAVGLVPTRLRTSRTKLPAPPGSWKPIRSAPSRPSRIWRRQGSWEKSSTGGKGMWR